jgi:hypothetical protein
MNSLSIADTIKQAYKKDEQRIDAAERANKRNEVIKAVYGRDMTRYLFIDNSELDFFADDDF